MAVSIWEGNKAQALIDAIANNQKIDKQQGTANAGKALVVGSDGLVGFGNAGITDAAKVALVNCFLRVAWVDDTGAALIQTLANALNVNDWVDPIEALVYNLPRGTSIKGMSANTGVPIFGADDDYTILINVTCGPSTESRVVLNHGLVSTGTLRLGFEYDNGTLKYVTNVMHASGYYPTNIDANVSHNLIYVLRMSNKTARKVFYLNGVKQVDNSEDISSYISQKTFTGNYTIGAYNSSETAQLDAIVNVFRIYNKALSFYTINSILGTDLT